MIKTLDMKRLINLILVFTFSFTLWSQECETALNLNGSDKTISPATHCEGDTVSFFTYIFCDSILHSNSVNINFVSFKEMGIGDGFTVKVFGPFNSLQEGCTLLSSSTPNDNPSYLNSGGHEDVTLNAEDLTINQFYIFKIDFQSCYNGIYINKTVDEPRSPTPPSIGNGEYCQECLPHFSPPIGKYIVTAWVKEKDASVYTVSYVNSKIEIYNASTLIDQFYPTGNIIDGWQKIEGVFELTGYINFEMKLVATGSEKSYFDDIRVQPFNSSMITYVYDPLTLRLVAELDERNYAKLYEYDEEGKLIRIKKETEKGIMTIQETRENSSK